MRRNKKAYWIEVGDIQHIAEEELNRRLTEEELEKVIDKMGDFMNWGEAITYTFMELKLEEAEDVGE